MKIKDSYITTSPLSLAVLLSLSVVLTPGANATPTPEDSVGEVAQPVQEDNALQKLIAPSQSAEAPENMYEQEASLHPGRAVRKHSGTGGTCSQKIAAAIGHNSAEVKCLTKLFMAESGCNPTVTHPVFLVKGKGKHKRKVRNNPNRGFGLCAIETDPGVRAANGRGPACRTVKSFEQQTKCCLDISRKLGRKYFGTMRTGRAYRCK